MPFKESNCSSSAIDIKESTVVGPTRNSSGKERGRLDKSHSTPAYDFTESDDDFIEKKFEAALDEHYKQQQQQKIRVDSSSSNSISSSSNKTDSRLFDSVEDLEEHEKMTTPKCANDDRSRPRLIGNVARKIIDIEKNLQIKR